MIKVLFYGQYTRSDIGDLISYIPNSLCDLPSKIEKIIANNLMANQRLFSFNEQKQLTVNYLKFNNKILGISWHNYAFYAMYLPFVYVILPAYLTCTLNKTIILPFLNVLINSTSYQKIDDKKDRKGLVELNKQNKETAIEF